MKKMKVVKGLAFSAILVLSLLASGGSAFAKGGGKSNAPTVTPAGVTWESAGVTWE